MMKLPTLALVAACTSHATVSPQPPAAPAPAPRAEEEQKASGRHPSTAEERERALAIIKDSELRPLATDDETRGARAWMLAWVANAPDITIIACNDLLGSVDEHRGYAHFDPLLVQTLWGELAFIIEHRGASPRDPAVFEAGLRSALAAYRSILQAEPDASWPFLDRVAQLEADGKLREYVEHAMKECMR